jgi:hypothetical protein
VPVPCIPTSDTGIGSSCNLSTTLDAVVPGIAIEGKRALWQIASVDVFDGGADGDLDTAPNTLFLQQGTFVP